MSSSRVDPLVVVLGTIVYTTLVILLRVFFNYRIYLQKRFNFHAVQSEEDNNWKNHQKNPKKKFYFVIFQQFRLFALVLVPFFKCIF